MEKSHEPQSYKDVRDEYTRRKNASVEKDLPALFPGKGQIGDKKDHRGKSARVDPVNETRDQNRRETPSLKPRNNALFTFFESFFRYFLPAIIVVPYSI